VLELREAALHGRFRDSLLHRQLGRVLAYGKRMVINHATLMGLGWDQDGVALQVLHHMHDCG
jgi:hypothetical protein